MSITRREAFSLTALIAAGSAIPAFAAKDDALPSATYPFESMPVQVLDHVQMREILKGKLATGEHIEAHETTLKCGLSVRELSNLRLTMPATV